MPATSVFRGQVRSTVSGEGSVITSGAIQPQGNRAVLAVTVVNATSSITSATFKLRGSYDGSLWKDITSGSITSLTAFGYANSSAVTIDHAFVQVFAEIAGTSQRVLFDATIAWSQQ